MKIFGLTIAPTAQVEATNKQVISPIATNGGWRTLIREAWAGAWQQNVSISFDTVMSNHAVFACQTLISSDIAKLRVKLVAQDSNGIWTETKNPAYSPVLRKPNHYQNRIQFFETWVLSKLQRGNTYILLQRDGRRVVTKMYVLDPTRVVPLVASDGSVYYELQTDNLSEIVSERVVVPSSEIIHDRFNCFFHPLVGMSPIYANGLAATQGLAIQSNSTLMFQNGARPSGILTAPGDIKPETAQELKAYWENNFSGANSAKVAVLGDGLKYEAMSMKSTDAQLIEQLKWTADVVCSTYHVPPYKIGIGQQPTYNNVQALNVEYYSQCLQVLIESIEVCLDEGLGTGETLGAEFDTDNLLRMDSAAQMAVLKEGTGAGILEIDEARAALSRKPTPGGNAAYLQQQNYSLEALAKRDAQDDPFAGPKPAVAPEPANDDEAEAQEALKALKKGLS